jgi:hypothetical protein
MPIARFDARQPLHERRDAVAGTLTEPHATTNAEQRINLLASLGQRPYGAVPAAAIALWQPRSQELMGPAHFADHCP